MIRHFQSFSGAKRLRIQEISGSSFPDDAVLSVVLNISEEQKSHLWLPGFVSTVVHNSKIHGHWSPWVHNFPCICDSQQWKDLVFLTKPRLRNHVSGLMSI